MKYAVILLIGLWVVPVHAQDFPGPPASAPKKVIPIEEEHIIGQRGGFLEPEFIGGSAALLSFIVENFQPDCPMEEGQLTQNSTIYARFYISENGAVSNVSIVRGISECIDQHAVKLLSGMPPWKPALDEKGNPIGQWSMLPLRVCFNQ